MRFQQFSSYEFLHSLCIYIFLIQKRFSDPEILGFFYTFFDIFRSDEQHLLADVDPDGVGVAVAVEVAPNPSVHTGT